MKIIDTFFLRGWGGEWGGGEGELGVGGVRFDI